MTAQEAVRALEELRAYASPKTLPALDYAIEAILEKQEREKQ